MAKICSECGTSNPDDSRVCANCGQTLAPRDVSSARPARRSEGRRTGPWIATLLIALLVLCCVSLVGLALLDELMPSHPFQALIVGTPTATPTPPPTPTARPTDTPTPPPPPEPGADPFEPDDSLAEARPIETDGLPQAHTLNPAGDRDYVSFEVEAGTTYVVETGELGPECDTLLTLYDEDGMMLDQDDDAGAESLASQIRWTSRQEGIVYAEVRQFDEVVQGDGTEYEIWVVESEPVVLTEDEYEPDDIMHQANAIILGVPQTHTIHDVGDRDWVFFEAIEGQTYVIETSNLRGGMDTIIFLHDEEGTKLAENDDSADDQASRITWRARSSATLYVVVQDYYESEVTREMGYTITVSEGTPYDADEYEPDDTQDQAGTIEVNSYQAHDLHVTGDHDWVCFEAVSGTNYVVETFNLGDWIDTYIALYDSEGRLLAENDDGGEEPLSSLLVWTAVENGELCVMAGDLADGRAGPGTEYMIAVQEEGTRVLTPDSYEPDDTLATARSIELQEPQWHNIHTAGDHDWLSLQAEAGVTYVVETHDLDAELDTVLFLYDSDGEELVQDDDSSDEPRASLITWTAQEAGTLYVLVRDYKDDRATRGMGYYVSVHESYDTPDR